jgi:hypothetical protein
MCRSGAVRATTSPTCAPSEHIYIHFCGQHQASAQRGERYLPGGDWLRTMIHEYAHAGCPGTGQIFPAGSEFYKGESRYLREADMKVKIADCYAWFTMDAR